jgi:hypothetical protein
MMPMLTMPEHKRAYQTQDLADWVLFWSAVNAQVHFPLYLYPTPAHIAGFTGIPSY